MKGYINIGQLIKTENGLKVLQALLNYNVEMARDLTEALETIASLNPKEGMAIGQHIARKALKKYR